METYLDYNATTPLDPRVLEAMKPFFGASFGNASSFHQKGQASRNAVETAREEIADSLEVEPGDILFTSGGTEADNLAIKGVMESLKDAKPHLVVSSIEHQAVFHPAKYLEKQGFKVSFIPVDKHGAVDLEKLKDAVTDKTALVSVMHVNNEVGTIEPVEEISRIAKSKGAIFHVDAVQSFGKMNIHPEEMGIDMLSMSAHKICGPKGVGALYVKKGLKVKPQVHGGHQEKNIRPGTENVAAIAGFGEAVKIATKEHAAEEIRVRLLRDAFEKGLFESIPGAYLNGHSKDRIYNTLNVSFEGLDGETLLMNLDLKNIYVSTGSACTAGSVEPSHVLIAMGLPEKLARAAIRFSLGRFTKKEEIDYVLNELPKIVERLRKTATHAH